LLRIDPAHKIAGLRVNDWVSVIVFAVAIGFVVTGRMPHRPGAEGADQAAQADDSPGLTDDSPDLA